jgi:hypothetical protein
MASALLLTAAALLLALHYRWALLDPHAPRLGPSWSSAVVTAGWVTALFAAALLAQAAGYGREAAFTCSFAFGTAISPSIAPPYRLTPDEEPSPLRRFLKSRVHSFRVLSIKMLLIVPVSLLLDLLVPRHPSFFASALVALLFSGVKAAYLVELLRAPPRTAADHEVRRTLTIDGVVRNWRLGTVALVAWLAVIYPVTDGFPEPELDDYAMVTAFAVGLLLRPN